MVPQPASFQMEEITAVVRKYLGSPRKKMGSNPNCWLIWFTTPHVGEMCIRDSIQTDERRALRAQVFACPDKINLVPAFVQRAFEHGKLGLHAPVQQRHHRCV